MGCDQQIRMRDQLLQKLESRGFISVHFTIYRDFTCLPPKRFNETRVVTLRKWARGENLLGKAIRWAWRICALRGAMLMYAYDLNRICALCHQYGIEELALVHTNHGGHHVWKCTGAPVASPKLLGPAQPPRPCCAVTPRPFGSRAPRRSRRGRWRRDHCG